MMRRWSLLLLLGAAIPLFATDSIAQAKGTRWVVYVDSSVCMFPHPHESSANGVVGKRVPILHRDSLDTVEFASLKGRYWVLFDEPSFLYAIDDPSKKPVQVVEVKPKNQPATRLRMIDGFPSRGHWARLIYEVLKNKPVNPVKGTPKQYLKSVPKPPLPAKCPYDFDGKMSPLEIGPGIDGEG